MLNTFLRVNVPVYGITAEEHHAITQKKFHETLAIPMCRLLRLKRESKACCEVSVRFRAFNDYTVAEIEEFKQVMFGEVISRIAAVATYCNWVSIHVARFRYARIS